jgi:hypothetical protein
MKAWKLLPLLLLATACSKSHHDETASETFQVTNDPGFNQALQDYVTVRDALRVKRCDEKSCFVPRYPKNKPLLEEIKAAVTKADAIVNYPAPADVGARERSRAHDWKLGMLAHAAKIEASVADTEAKLAVLEPQLAPLRENLRLATERAAAEGCSLPAEGKVISCAGVEPPLESPEEARGLLREIETAATLSQAFKALQGAYESTAPGLESEELQTAKKKSTDLDRYLELIRPTFGSQVRELVKARWTAVLEQFRENGLQASYPASLDQAYEGEPSEAMVNQARAGLASADNFLGIARNAQQFSAKAIDRIEVVDGASAGYGAEAFQYHPAHEKSLTVKINADAGFFSLNWLLMGIPSRSDERYVGRQALIQTWERARANPPEQEESGTIVPISIHVDDDYLDGLVTKLKLQEAIGTMNALSSARASLNTKLDAALRASGRSLKGGERFVICDFNSCGRALPNTYVLELNDRNPQLTEARLDGLVARLTKAL